MDLSSDEAIECGIRMDAAIGLLALASSRLKDVIFSGHEDLIKEADLSMRFARFRFLEARAEYREICQGSR